MIENVLFFSKSTKVHQQNEQKTYCVPVKMDKFMRDYFGEETKTTVKKKCTNYIAFIRIDFTRKLRYPRI